MNFRILLLLLWMLWILYFGAVREIRVLLRWMGGGAGERGVVRRCILQYRSWSGFMSVLVLACCWTVGVLKVARFY